VSETGEPAPARPAKGAAAFRTIGEVAADLDLPAHVLRFWESKFPQLKPLKRGGGRRYYRPEDVLLLRRIRQCLYQDGYTIRGVRQLLGAAGGSARPPPDPARPPSLFPPEAAAPAEPRGPTKPSLRPPRRRAGSDVRAALEEIRKELAEARVLLDELTGRPRVP
jgi:DNA-binding transcriptional MerR regulator